MAKTSRAVVMVGREFEVREYPVPEPAPGTMLLRQEMSGICASDVHAWEHQRLSGAVLLGHENVGVIAALGEGTTADSNGRPLAVGDRVIFAPGTPAYGYGYCQADQMPHLRGGYADFTYLAHPESCILKTSLPTNVAVLTEPFTIGVHAVMRAGITFGDTVVVQGSGAIGLLTLIGAKLSGAGRLIMVGGPAGRLELARQLGAGVVIDIADVRDPSERTKLVLGCRYRGQPTTREDIRAFAENQVKVATAEYPGVYAAYFSGSGFTQGAVQEALARGVTLVTLKAINELARAAGHQPFSPP